MVWCSDEFYLKAGRPLPDEESFERFVQLENGVGMLRLLESEFRAALLSVEGTRSPPPLPSPPDWRPPPPLRNWWRRLGGNAPASRARWSPS